ncbi:MAG: RagB/SusD family nutrient uptake outer membrane protein [Bacteroidales bacterium]
MKKLIYIILIGLLAVSCEKNDLKLVNPNEPGLDALATEEGCTRLAYSVWVPLRDNTFWWFVIADHNIMGDALTISAGNFGWRWGNQTEQITLPDGTVYYPPNGSTQPVELRNRNDRSYGQDNIFSHEWIPVYGVIQTANFVLENVENASFAGTDEAVAIKKNTLKCWAYWWKGWGYSRIASVHAQGIIVDKYNATNPDYVSYSDLLIEAKNNFDAAKDILASIDEDNEPYFAILSKLVPSYLVAGRGGLFTPQMWIRNINTYLARNILVNKYADDLTAQDISDIETLCNNGIGDGDYIFTARAQALDDLVYNTAWAPYRLLVGWENVSERWVQDFKPGDARRTRNVMPLATVNYNPRGRGIQYGTRWTLRPIENGGDYASTVSNLAELAYCGTYEENQLMLAEAKIRTDQIDEGLAHIDNVRNYQNASLAAVSGTGLTKAQALEELREERRIALFINGTAFYDARRWKLLGTNPGRAKAVVLTSPTAIDSCAIKYGYLERWDLPANETDFNPVVSATSRLINGTIVPE